VEEYDYESQSISYAAMAAQLILPRGRKQTPPTNLFLLNFSFSLVNLGVSEVIYVEEYDMITF
jgi:hypothetical protein